LFRHSHPIVIIMSKNNTAAAAADAGAPAAPSAAAAAPARSLADIRRELLIKRQAVIEALEAQNAEGTSSVAGIAAEVGRGGGGGGGAGAAAATRKAGAKRGRRGDGDDDEYIPEAESVPTRRSSRVAARPMRSMNVRPLGLGWARGGERKRESGSCTPRAVNCILECCDRAEWG
jgi:hypothetical protein